MYCAFKLKDGLYDDSIYDRVDRDEILIDSKTDITVLCL
jgi:hypothetical protein